MASGSLRVSFAGTIAEAREYCQDHPGLTAPKGLESDGDDVGLPMLCAVYRNDRERSEKSELLRSLGWDYEFQQDRTHGQGFK